MMEIEHSEGQRTELIGKIRKIDANLAKLDEKVNDLERKTHTIVATGGLDIDVETRKAGLLYDFLTREKAKLEQQLAELLK
jgi:hypothetical protein